MSDTDYNKVYGGSFIIANRLKAELEAVGISPIIKDEGESQRLGGQSSINNGFQTIFVNDEEHNKALKIVNRVLSEMES